MNLDKIKELGEEREKVIKIQETINDKAVEENRALTPEEQEQWDNADKDFEKYTNEIEALRTADEKEQKRKDDLEKRRKDMKKNPYNDPIRPDPNNNDEDTRDLVDLPESGEFRTALQAYREITGGKLGTKEYRDLFNRALSGDINAAHEVRALQADLDASGGFLVAPEQFTTELIKDVDNMAVVKSKAKNIYVAKAASYGAPALQDDPADPVWTSEIKTGDEDSTMDFEKRDLYPHPVAKRIKVSEPLIRKSLLGIDNLVRERLAYKLEYVAETAFMTGDGTNKPLGLFTGSNLGISTSRDVTAHNTTTALKADNIVDTFYNLKAQYMQKAEWIMHRDVVKMIRKLKTGEGEYIWQSGLAENAKPTIMGRPYTMSEYAPNTFSSAEYMAIVGDFSWYWIVTALNMQVKVLSELYAETNQIGYIIRAEIDAMPVLEEAFSRSKLGS